MRWVPWPLVTDAWSSIEREKTKAWLKFRFFFQAEDGIRDHCVTGVQTCALPISLGVSPHSFVVGRGRRAGRSRRFMRRSTQSWISALQIEFAPGAQALAGNRFELIKFNHLEALLFSVAGDGAGPWGGRKTLQRVSKLCHPPLPAPGETFDRFYAP